VNYDNSLVVTITVTCYSWVPSSGVHLFSCVAISRPPHNACFAIARITNAPINLQHVSDVTKHPIAK